MTRISAYLELLDHHPWLIASNNGLIKIITDKTKLASWVKGGGDEIGVLLQDKYITFIRDLVEFPDGSLGTYNRIINTAAFKQGSMGVAVLPIIRGKVLLLNIFRHPTRQWSIEIPRGFGEGSLTSLEVAKKEVWEEIEGEIQEVIDLGEIHSNSGLEGNKINLYLAILNKHGRPAGNEGIKTLKAISILEFEKLINGGQITDAFTIAAYTKAKLRGLL